MATKGTRSTTFLVLLVPFAALCLFAGPAFGQTVWDGVYTADQATRGQAAYAQYCVACHKADLLGIEGAMKGEPFMERRREDNLETLFLDMKATMPRGKPGSLPDQTYSDIISYLLQNNDMPAGAVELKRDSLDKVQLVGTDGPQPVPNFAPVLTVGCRSKAAQTHSCSSMRANRFARGIHSGRSTRN